MVEVIRELHLEHLVDRRVRDANGEVAGRLQEMIVQIADGEPVIVEFHLGPAAILERMTGFVRQLPFFSLLPWHPRVYRVGWRDVDLSDPHHPRLRCSKSELERVDR